METQTNQEYNIDILCLNCRKRRSILVPFGTYVRDYMNANKFVCDKCGCAFING